MTHQLEQGYVVVLALWAVGLLLFLYATREKH